jgi:hypothetical protein
LGSFGHVVAYRDSSKNIRNINLIHILNKYSPWAHIKLEFDMLGVAKQLVKYVVHLSKIKNKEIKKFPSSQGDQTPNESFSVSRKFWG